MPIYKSAILKYIKSISTWIPLLISIIVVILIGVVMPFVFLDLSRTDVVSTYQIYTIVSVSTIASSTALFSATFAAYKTTQIYKHEIEEGTFLILISKPVSRKRIIIEKLLALFTILFVYTFIIIFIYQILIICLDPGYKIPNLQTPKISENIWLIGFILFLIILMINILFSSIAFLISVHYSSASTIASVAGLGALIPVSGIIPAFTLNNDYSIISKNATSTLTGKEPSEVTKNYLNNLPSLDPNQSTNNFEIQNLFKELEVSSNKINSSQDFVNKIALNSGEKNIYKSIFIFDLNYQLNQISSVATDYLWGNINKYSVINSSNSALSTRPDVIGKKVVVDNNIEINNMIDRIDNTMKEWKNVIESKEYLDTFYKLFNIILKLRDVKGATQTTDTISYNKNLLLLYKSFIKDGVFNVELFNSFIQAPLISSIMNSNLDDMEELKNEIKDRNKPIRYEIKILESIFLFKIMFDFKLGTDLMFSSFAIDDYYYKNNLYLLSIVQDSSGNFVLDKEGQEYFESIKNKYPNFVTLIDNYFKLPTNEYNYKSILTLLNVFRLSDQYGIKLKSIEFKPYANKWILFFGYLSFSLILIPITYLVIKKQNIR